MVLEPKRKDTWSEMLTSQGLPSIIKGPMGKCGHIGKRSERVQ